MPADGLVPPRVPRADLDDVPTLFAQLDGLGERAVRSEGDLLAVDLHPRPRLGAAVDHGDTTVGFDVSEVKLGRSRVLLLTAAVVGGGSDAELPRLAPGSLQAVRPEGGDPPLKAPLAAQPQGGPRLGPVLRVDDVVDEQVVAGDLEGIMGGAGHRLPGEDQLLGGVEVEQQVVHRLDPLRPSRAPPWRGEGGAPPAPP